MERKQNTAGTAPAIDALLEGLNPAQRSAATYGIDAEEGPPPLLIAAGAGTGKTKTLAHRVARLILGGADPRRLLLLTFTRRAALEMTRPGTPPPSRWTQPSPCSTAPTAPI